MTYETPMDKWMDFVLFLPFNLVDKYSKPWTLKRAVFSFVCLTLAIPWFLVTFPIDVLMLLLMLILGMMESEE